MVQQSQFHDSSPVDSRSNCSRVDSPMENNITMHFLQERNEFEFYSSPLRQSDHGQEVEESNPLLTVHSREGRLASIRDVSGAKDCRHSTLGSNSRIGRWKQNCGPDLCSNLASTTPLISDDCLRMYGSHPARTPTRLAVGPKPSDRCHLLPGFPDRRKDNVVTRRQNLVSPLLYRRAPVVRDRSGSITGAGERLAGSGSA